MLLTVQVLLVGLRPRAADLAHLAVEDLHGLSARVPPLTLLAAVAVVVEAAAAARMTARMCAPVAELGRARLARQLTPLGAAVLRPVAHHVGRVGGRVIAGRGRGRGAGGRGRALLLVLVALGRGRDRDAIETRWY